VLDGRAGSSRSGVFMFDPPKFIEVVVGFGVRLSV
jgi:hypothetical protein